MTQLISTPRGNVVIHVANTNDATQLYGLRLEALQLHPDAFAADVDMTMENGSEAWVTLIENYARDQSGAITIASAQDKLIGMTGLVRGRWPKTRHNATLWGVYVNHIWRGFHIAEAIINECLTWARENGVVVVKLGVVTTNLPAIRCYTRCGFTIYGTDPKSNSHNGVYYDEYLMAKEL
jgi:RimJ/RimL family protein N-acetyltransferase